MCLRYIGCLSIQISTKKEPHAEVKKKNRKKFQKVKSTKSTNKRERKSNNIAMVSFIPFLSLSRLHLLRDDCYLYSFCLSVVCSERIFHVRKIPQLALFFSGNVKTQKNQYLKCEQQFSVIHKKNQSHSTFGQCSTNIKHNFVTSTSRFNGKKSEKKSESKCAYGHISCVYISIEIVRVDTAARK